MWDCYWVQTMFNIIKDKVEEFITTDFMYTIVLKQNDSAYIIILYIIYYIGAIIDKIIYR